MQLADFSGGSLICVIGILMALLERQNSVRNTVYREITYVCSVLYNLFLN